MSKKPVFNNRENELVELPDGRQVWLSRACAAVVTILASFQGELYVAMAQRGPKSADFRGLWCLPCGYLDWDEAGHEAARRETWEEIGLDLDRIDPATIRASHLEQPWYVNTNPKQNRQNISLSYGIYFAPNELPTLTLGEQEGECSATAWKPVSWVLTSQDAIAFNHERRVSDYLLLALGGRT